jgi:hypothetical protein
MAQSSENIYSSLRTFGGLALCYSALTEVDFTATAGIAYAPPESGNFRRINITRTLQLLSDATGVIETFQTSAADIRLPANTLTESTNDAGDGRLFFLKNSGTGSITVKDYLGNVLWQVREFGVVIVVGNDNNNWDFYFTAKNIDFNNLTNGFLSNNVQGAIEEVKTYGEGFPRAGLSLTYNATLTDGNYITYTELLANPRIVFPVKIRIKELTWNNSNLNLGAFTFNFYKNGQAAGNLIHTYTPLASERIAGFGYTAIPLDLDFNAGDYMYIKYLKPSGTSLSDLGLVVWLARWG